MRYQHVFVEAIACTLPPHVVTSEEIEERLAPVYAKLGLPEGRLEMMTGIRERRFFDPGTRPGAIMPKRPRRRSIWPASTGRYIGALVHGSVCRDQLEPATASSVHYALDVPATAAVFDVSNACLGLLNGMTLLADMIELGHIRAGIVVGTEVGRDLVEGTIDTLLHNPNLTRDDMKREFASLTIGSGSAAIVLCDDRLSRTGRRLVGGAAMADSTGHQLCAGGIAAEKHGDHRPRMQTDSEALMHAGVNLAVVTWKRRGSTLGWTNNDVDKVFTHQVGRAIANCCSTGWGCRRPSIFPPSNSWATRGLRHSRWRLHWASSKGTCIKATAWR